MQNCAQPWGAPRRTGMPGMRPTMCRTPPVTLQRRRLASCDPQGCPHPSGQTYFTRPEQGQRGGGARFFSLIPARDLRPLDTRRIPAIDLAVPSDTRRIPAVDARVPSHTSRRLRLTGRFRALLDGALRRPRHPADRFKLSSRSVVKDTGARARF